VLINNIKFIDLFAGMGGFKIGLNKAANKLSINTKCVLTSDIKSSAISVLNTNGLDINLVNNIQGIDEKEIPSFDLLLAGFPCQPFSVAGNRQGFSDTRGTLFFDIERILEYHKPSAFILENVPHLKTHDNGRTFSVITSTLIKLGYSISSEILDSSDFGLAQSRKRIYIVGIREDLNKRFIFDNINHGYKTAVFGDISESGLPIINSEFTNKLLSKFTIDEVEGKLITDKRGGDNSLHSWDFGLKGEITYKQSKILDVVFKIYRSREMAKELGMEWKDGGLVTTEQIYRNFPDKDLQADLDYLVDCGYLITKNIKISDFGEEKEIKAYSIITSRLSYEFNRILDKNGTCPTLTATDCQKIGVIDGNGIRKLTPREGLRLFGYPEDYSFGNLSDKQIYDLLGNTVPVNVIEAISNRLLNTLIEV